MPPGRGYVRRFRSARRKVSEFRGRRKFNKDTRRHGSLTTAREKAMYSKTEIARLEYKRRTGEHAPF